MLKDLVREIRYLDRSKVDFSFAIDDNLIDSMIFEDLNKVLSVEDRS